MSDGTLKDVGVIGQPEVDLELNKIRKSGQSKNFKIVTASPGASDGQVGNIWIFDDRGGSGNVYLMVKVDSTTWVQK